MGNAEYMGLLQGQEPSQVGRCTPAT